MQEILLIIAVFWVEDWEKESPLERDGITCIYKVERTFVPGFAQFLP